MKKIYILVGGMRPHWLGKRIAQWVRFNAKNNSEAVYKIIDINRISPGSDFMELKDADGVIVISPEYSNGIPRKIQDAVARTGKKITNLPVAFVSYGQEGSSKMLEGLRQHAKRYCLQPIRRTVHLSKPWENIDQNGELHSKRANQDLSIMINQLLKFSTVNLSTVN